MDRLIDNEVERLKVSSIERSLDTVWLKWIAPLILRHYKSNLAHFSDLYILVIGLYKYERRAKEN